MIKKLLATIAVASAGLLAAPNADAGHTSSSQHTYRSGYSSCGCPIYTTRFVRGYDCYRRPIFGYVQAPMSHGSSCRHRAVVRRQAVPVYRTPVYSSRSRPVYGSRVSIGSHGVRIDLGSRSHSRGYSRGRSCR